MNSSYQIKCLISTLISSTVINVLICNCMYVNVLKIIYENTNGNEYTFKIVLYLIAVSVLKLQSIHENKW